MSIVARYLLSIFALLALAQNSMAGSPVFIDTLQDLQVQEDFAPIHIKLGVKVQDPDFDPLTYTVSAKANVTTTSISGDTLNIVAKANQNGNDTLIIGANDGNSPITYDTVLLAVTAVNDAPTRPPSSSRFEPQ